MARLAESESRVVGFKHLARNMRISDRASIYNTEQIEIGGYSRTDDFFVISGKITFGRYVHIACW